MYKMVRYEFLCDHILKKGYLCPQNKDTSHACYQNTLAILVAESALVYRTMAVPLLGIYRLGGGFVSTALRSRRDGPSHTLHVLAAMSGGVANRIGVT